MKYLIDGYNVIHMNPVLEKQLEKDLKTARDHLVQLSHCLWKRRGDVDEITIVFDGQSTFADLVPEELPGVRLIYTETGEDADDRIGELLCDATNPASICVVSNDNQVRNHCRASKAKLMDARAYFQLMNENPEQREEDRDVPLSAGEEKEITEAYRRILGI